MMSDLIRWNPLDELRRFADEFERRFSTWSRPGSAGASAPVDVSSDQEGWTAGIALPGFAPENVEVYVAGRTLHVRAVQKDGDRVVGRVEELLTLPEAVDASRVAASFRHGLLELTLPYKEETRPRRIEISTSDRKQLTAA